MLVSRLIGIRGVSQLMPQTVNINRILLVRKFGSTSGHSSGTNPHHPNNDSHHDEHDSHHHEPTASPTQIIITFGTIGLVVVSLAAHGLIGKSE